MKRKSIFSIALTIALLAGMMSASMAIAAPKPTGIVSMFPGNYNVLTHNHLFTSQLTVLSPAEGKYLKTGQTYTTQFESCSCVTAVKIHLFGTPGTKSYYLGSVVPTGSIQDFQFTVPADMSVDNDVHLVFFITDKYGNQKVIYSPTYKVGKVDLIY